MCVDACVSLNVFVFMCEDAFRLSNAKSFLYIYILNIHDLVCSVFIAYHPL